MRIINQLKLFIMKNSRQFKSKVASTIFAFLLIFTMILPPNQASAEGDKDKMFREGTCWLDGSKTCRKKRKGEPCSEGSAPKGCSAEAYLDTVSKGLGIAVAIITISKQ